MCGPRENGHESCGSIASVARALAERTVRLHFGYRQNYWVAGHEETKQAAAAGDGLAAEAHGDEAGGAAGAGKKGKDGRHYFVHLVNSDLN